MTQKASEPETGTTKVRATERVDSKVVEIVVTPAQHKAAIEGVKRREAEGEEVPWQVRRIAEAEVDFDDDLIPMIVPALIKQVETHVQARPAHRYTKLSFTGESSRFSPKGLKKKAGYYRIVLAALNERREVLIEDAGHAEPSDDSTTSAALPLGTSQRTHTVEPSLTPSYAELSSLDDKALEDRLRDAKEQLFNLRFQAATGQLASHGHLRHAKKGLARIATVLRERELGISRSTVDSEHAEAEKTN